MTTQQKIGVGVVGVVVVASAALLIKLKALSSQATTHNVVINTVSDKSCTPSPDPVYIEIQDQASWTAVDQDYYLLFANSPFTNVPSGNNVKVPMGQTVTSGGVLWYIQAACILGCQKNYEYSISISGKSPGCPRDPVVVVGH